MYVCREKEVGGLGIKDLRALNLVLLEEGLSGGRIFGIWMRMVKGM